MNEKDVSRLFWVVKAVLAAMLVYVAVRAVVAPLHLGGVLEPEATSGDERALNVAQANSEPHNPIDISAILENSLFAEKDSSGSLQRGHDDPASSMTSAEQDLGLRLMGSIAGTATTSRAIIEDTTAKTTRPYKTGDVVASATIESIQPNTVILRHEGRRRILRLHRGTTTDNPPANKIGEQGSTNVPESRSAKREMAPPSAKLGYVEDLFRNATVEPYLENGQPQGLKITGLENTPVAGMFGLRNGDVVQTVNGQHLTNRQKAFQVLQKARTQSKMHIQLLRHGKTRDLSFDL